MFRSRRKEVMKMKGLMSPLPVLFVAAALGLSAAPYVQAGSVEEEEETEIRFETGVVRLTPEQMEALEERDDHLSGIPGKPYVPDLVSRS
jgi:hypothetical protein